MSRLELQEITIAGAARAEVIEPLVRLRERHCTRGDSSENVSARAPDAVRIRKLLEQTTIQHIQDALLVALGISLSIQTVLLRELYLLSARR